MMGTLDFIQMPRNEAPDLNSIIFLQRSIAYLGVQATVLSNEMLDIEARGRQIWA
jgi:hypothetical protein